MSEIKNREFLILSKAKQLVFDIDDILENVPRKDTYYKDKLKEYCNDLIYNILLLNNLNNKKDIYFCKIFTNISMIDMYLWRLNSKKYIVDNPTKRMAILLVEINKMCITWRKNNAESQY